MSEEWKRQYERIRRWYNRVNGIRLSSEYLVLQDDLLAFFMNCYHLRDWLIHGSPIDEKAVDEYINRNNYLSACRQLANGTKHLHCRRRPNDVARVFYKPNAYEVEFGTSTGGAGRSLINELSSAVSIEGSTFDMINKLAPGEFIIEYDNRTYDIIKFTTECLSAWDLFLKDKGLMDRV
ncbi:MAG: hypothetical protein ACM3QZ_09790 [Solirubrobacterales bacterium]